MNLYSGHSVLNTSLMFKVALIKLSYVRYMINKERAIEKKVMLTMYETLKVKQLQCLRLLLV